MNNFQGANDIKSGGVTIEPYELSVPVPRLARRLKIGPFWYEIAPGGRGKLANNWGETDLGHREMRFDVTCTETQLPLTLLHEIIHAVNSNLNLLDDEDHVKRLTIGLGEVLQDLGWLPSRLKLADDP